MNHNPEDIGTRELIRLNNEIIKQQDQDETLRDFFRSLYRINETPDIQDNVDILKEKSIILWQKNYVNLEKLLFPILNIYDRKDPGVQDYPLESYVPYMAHEDLQGAPSRIPNKIT